MLDGSKQEKMKQEFNKKIYFNRKPQFCSSRERAGWSSFKFLLRNSRALGGAQPSCCFPRPTHAGFSGALLLASLRKPQAERSSHVLAPLLSVPAFLLSLCRHHFPSVRMGELSALSSTCALDSTRSLCSGDGRPLVCFSCRML